MPAATPASHGARLQTSGTRGAHTLRFAARGDAFDASGEVRGGWNGNAWTGTVAALQNKGRYAFTLAGARCRCASPARPAPGVMGLLKPRADRRCATARRSTCPPAPSRVESLDKIGPRWTSKGARPACRSNYLAQFSPTLRDNLRGDLTLGAQWALDLRAPAGRRRRAGADRQCCTCSAKRAT